MKSNLSPGAGVGVGVGTVVGVSAGVGVISAVGSEGAAGSCAGAAGAQAEMQHVSAKANIVMLMQRFICSLLIIISAAGGAYLLRIVAVRMIFK